MEFFHVVKATQKSGKKDAVIWFSAKSEARANLQLDVELEDADIETGRGKDYAKPVRTDMPVVDDLPEEGVVDFTWCERYELAEDQRTWQLKDGAAPQDAFHQEDAGDADADADADAEQVEDNIHESKIVNVEYNIAPMGFRVQLLAQFMAEDLHVYCINKETQAQIAALEMDTDNTYVQNLLLAAENATEVKTFDMPTLWKLATAVKAVFPQDKRSELNQVIQFVKAWATTEHIDRVLLVKEWQKGNRVAQIQRTDAKTNAGGGNKTDRPDGYEHTLDTLDTEIALATLPMDFNIYEIPGSIHRRAKEIVSKKESPFAEWSKALRKTAGILDYSRAAIFALIRGAAENVHHFPVSLQAYINANLTESKHDAPTAETVAVAQNIAGNGDELNAETISHDEVSRRLAAARGEFVPGISDPTDPKWVHEDLTKPKQPKIASMGNGMFSIDGLMNAPAKQTEETTSDEPMEETERAEGETNDAVPAGESTVEDDQQTDTVTETSAADILAAAAPSLAAEEQSVPKVDSAPEEATPSPEETTSAPEEPQPAPVAEYPAFFEPGRYEGLPNSVYHAANGISSTQVKDARVSLMFYHGRHVTKTIRRESSDALTFGSLAHTLALEPEKLHEEFAVFPGIPAEAFTTTDSLKAFIRDYNTDKPKADQLKLTGKKEELQEAIRAVNPDAIFADEFEQQWRDSVAGKTILTCEQLNLATAIQQALLNHESAGKLLRHPSRAVETSYFGMDEETGLEVRVRPDLEVEVNGVRIGVDLKTISMGRVKQEGLRAKLHREIIDRDYHISAGMYCNVADFDQFFWIFVNKDEGYHWVAVIEASEDLLDLGLLEYQRTMRALAQAYDTDCWPAPVTEDYSDELNDFDQRRLEALRTQA
ncbi:RecE family exodeoxyribonuclease [Kluyvera cryocrescens]|uniref:RecE family exodeoxyribonuclease n=1 Tax=Kluyvera cryocrescens TaxID=580 RepID=UPI000D921A3B|nr:RecE family exodeoxyribonuclease [Kluyvera cryocrescens]SQC33608.1 Exodeoxyribonuclease 8 [Kluyvera cryocrescens]